MLRPTMPHRYAALGCKNIFFGRGANLKAHSPPNLGRSGGMLPPGKFVIFPYALRSILVYSDSEPNFTCNGSPCCAHLIVYLHEGFASVILFKVPSISRGAATTPPPPPQSAFYASAMLHLQACIECRTLMLQNVAT